MPRAHDPESKRRPQGQGDSQTMTIALFDPFVARPAVAVDAANAGTAMRRLASMFQIRAVEMKVAQLARANIASCPCHLAVGQEAVSVGLSGSLSSTGRGFGTPRSESP